MRTLAFVALFGTLGLLAGCGNSGSTGSGDDRSRFQGTWVFVKADYPPDFTDEKKKDFEDGFKEAEIAISGDQVTGTVPKKPGSAEKDTIKGTLKFDAAKSPRELDVTGTGDPDGKGEPTTIRCIYKFEGDRLVVAIGGGSRSDSPRPIEFKAVTDKEKEVRVIVVYLRKK